jgi:hypothetical protein
MRTVLNVALTRAVREEVIPRNAARLVELPQWQRGTIRPRTADEARQFLAVARPDPLYAVFVLLIFYGLRRGETLGLRWTDIGFEAGTFQVRQQFQRIQGPQTTPQTAAARPAISPITLERRSWCTLPVSCWPSSGNWLATASRTAIRNAGSLAATSPTVVSTNNNGSNEMKQDYARLPPARHRCRPRTFSPRR